MKALTLTQPWASLVAISAKKIETRSWSTTYRGPLAIHAAKGWTREDRELIFEEPFQEYLRLAGFRSPADFPLGAVLAIVDLVGCDLIRYAIPPEPERSFGNYEVGRSAWKMANLRRLLVPVPAKGALGLWEWKAEAQGAIAIGGTG